MMQNNKVVGPVCFLSGISFGHCVQEGCKKAAKASPLIMRKIYSMKLFYHVPSFTFLQGHSVSQVVDIVITHKWVSFFSSFLSWGSLFNHSRSLTWVDISRSLKPWLYCFLVVDERIPCSHSVKLFLCSCECSFLFFGFSTIPEYLELSSFLLHGFILV